MEGAGAAAHPAFRPWPRRLPRPLLRDGRRIRRAGPRSDIARRRIRSDGELRSRDEHLAGSCAHADAEARGGSHHHWRCRLRGGRRGRDRRLSPVVRARSFYAGWLIGLAAASHHVTLAPGVGERCSKSRMSPQANCARPWPTDQFSFADSRTFTNTFSGRMPGFSPSNSAVRRNSAFFCSAVRVSNTVIWM